MISDTEMNTIVLVISLLISMIVVPLILYCDWHDVIFPERDDIVIYTGSETKKRS